MIEITAGEIERECGGRMTSGMSELTTFTGIATDSRAVGVGDIFIAFRGVKTDGRAHIEQAVDRGAMCIIAEPDDAFPFLKTIPEMYVYITLIEVDDVLAAYQQIAKLIRRKSRARVIGVTGSTGKTTTKDMLAAILGQTGRAVASEENFNNEYGLPATFTQVEATTEFVVVEMGMRGIGQLAQLMSIARPHVGVITNVGVSHYELLGSEDKIAQAKSEMASGLTDKSFLVLNADDPYTPLMRQKTAAKVITFGAKGDVAATDVTYDELARASFIIKAKVDGEILSMPVTLPMSGAYNVGNALAATAAALAAGAAPSDIIAGLAKATPSSNRMAVLKTPGGATILNDTYNASPASMRAALETLAAMRGGRKVAVLGDMLELGTLSDAAHEAVGRLCADNGVELLITTGQGAAGIAAAAAAAGLAPGAVHRTDNADDACAALERELKSDDVVLIKASRALGLERIVECIK
jgi:UDP-N-acetylmuramoyl-tripeptide--D-alanyl-D-alanine ligase